MFWLIYKSFTIVSNSSNLCKLWIMKALHYNRCTMINLENASSNTILVYVKYEKGSVATSRNWTQCHCGYTRWYSRLGHCIIRVGDALIYFATVTLYNIQCKLIQITITCCATPPPRLFTPFFSKYLQFRAFLRLHTSPSKRLQDY